MFNCVTVCIRGILREFIRTPIKIICPRRSRGLMIILPGRRSQAKVKCIAHWLLLEPLSRARGQKPTYPLQPISSRCRPHLKRRGLYWVRGGRGGHAAQKKETNSDPHGSDHSRVLNQNGRKSVVEWTTYRSGFGEKKRTTWKYLGENTRVTVFDKRWEIHISKNIFPFLWP